MTTWQPPQNYESREAWDDLDMTPEHAREAIDGKIAVAEVYDRAERRALEEG